MGKIQSSPSHNSKTLWLYGFHTVKAALANSLRHSQRLLVKDEALLKELGPFPLTLTPEIVDKSVFQSLLGREAVHQGIALLTTSLPNVNIEDAIQELGPEALIVILDGVTDPHNIGAIIRSAAAFGANAVVLPHHHSPSEDNSIIAKTASGALETISLIRVTNLARTIQYLQRHDFWIYGLDEQGSSSLDALKYTGRNAFIFGAEGNGLRRLTRESCDTLIQLPTTSSFTTLNVSTSVAVALYEWRRQKLGPV